MTVDNFSARTQPDVFYFLLSPFSFLPSIFLIFIRVHSWLTAMQNKTANAL